MSSVDDSYDVVVIGAGPHALSLVCRLVDDEPDLLDEAARSHIMSKAGSRARPHTEVRRHLKKRYDARALLSKRLLVVDANGTWLSQWTRNFEALQIEHLRSHADLHCDPYDFQGLALLSHNCCFCVAAVLWDFPRFFPLPFGFRCYVSVFFFCIFRGISPRTRIFICHTHTLHLPMMSHAHGFVLSPQALRVWAEVHKRTDELWHMNYLNRDAARGEVYNLALTPPFCLDVSHSSYLSPTAFVFLFSL